MGTRRAIIMLLSIVSKVLHRVLLNRMKGIVDTKLRQKQAGPHCSTINHCWTLSGVADIDINMLYRLPKAFNSIHRKTFWKMLRHYGAPTKIVNIIRKFYKRFTAQVVHNGRLTDKIISNVDWGETGMSAIPPSLLYSPRLGNKRSILVIR